jgi:thiol-disulfide isomerase/thioredoxin
MAKGGFKKMKGGCVTTDSVLIVVLVVLVVILAYTYLNKSTPSAQPTKMMEHFESQPAPADLKPKEGEVIVALFSADWCPHCKDYKPAWQKLKAGNDNKSLNGKKVRFVDADCSDKAHPASSTYKVEGYPTVVAITTKTNKHIEKVTTMSEVEAAIAGM